MDENTVEDSRSVEVQLIQEIQKARKRLNLTQTQLAKRTGIDQGDISKLEHGIRNPSLKLLKRLAEGLDMDLVISFVPKKTAAASDQ